MKCTVHMELTIDRNPCGHPTHIEIYGNSQYMFVLYSNTIKTIQTITSSHTVNDKLTLQQVRFQSEDNSHQRLLLIA